jgi:hypothetical protein
MRVAYATTDEVNQALAAQMAAECGAIICDRRPGEVPPNGLFDAVLYNLDDVPRDQRPAFLEGLCLSTPDCPTAVHGYDITDEQARTLNRNGVAAARRLDLDLLRNLLTAARESRAAVPRDEAGTDLTWVNLAK